MLRNSALLVVLLVCNGSVHGALDLGFESGDSDLTNFVTRPEIKVPMFNVSIYDKSAVSPGLWFVAPYVGLHQHPTPFNYYQPCFTGPMIYDGQGELIWSGACLTKNQVAADFRVFTVDDTDHLSAIMYRSETDPKGHVILMDSSYTITDTIYAEPEIFNLDMHGFQVIENGRTGLHVNHKTKWLNLSALADQGIIQEEGFVQDSGFREFDLKTGRTIFQWWMSDYVPLSYSVNKVEHLDGPSPHGWNPFHINSVDKDENGDYLVSSRWTDCVYKVSAVDGAVIWRLGGVASSFVQDFNFSKQHNARFVSQNSTTSIISFLDNASAGPYDYRSTAHHSSALIIALDTSTNPMVAKIIRQHGRPDGRLTDRRGNVQLLPNDSLFVCWSENSIISEYTADGRMVMEAQWTSRRQVTYRGYKSSFRGFPTEPPVLKAFQYGAGADTGILVCYMSWNGATEVAFWEVHRAQEGHPRKGSLSRWPKSGFETVLQIPAWETQVYARAISAEGEVLGETAVETTMLVASNSFPSIRGPISVATEVQDNSKHAQPIVADRPGTKKPVIEGPIIVGQASLFFATTIMFLASCALAYITVFRRSRSYVADAYMPVAEI